MVDEMVDDTYSYAAMEIEAIRKNDSVVIVGVGAMTKGRKGRGSENGCGAGVWEGLYLRMGVDVG